MSEKKKTPSLLLWKQYTHGKQTYEQLAKHYGKSKRWVQYQLAAVHTQLVPQVSGDTVIVMDTTYFGKLFGVMVLRCAQRKKNLFWQFLTQETINDYLQGIQALRTQHWNIKAIVCDGKRGLFTAFDCPVQMCQFHQAAIVTRYVTRKPKLQAGVELQQLMRMLPKTDEASFTYWLQNWYEQWKEFLTERSTNPYTGRMHFTHRRLRSAYRSLKTNLPHLFTFERFPELSIPNTTNSLEGTFGHIKDKVRVHRGLKLERKQRLINQLLEGIH
jgi:hypothetical protein